MSLMYKRNKTGPKMDPWGTPDETFPHVHDQWVPITDTACVMLSKNEWIQSNVWSLIL